ncbi:GGDEF domain-containing protein [Phyllobacterium sp. OV277]|uniref:bifunctional diguanylate cyclase/phosphodiesterase n=1 Tax=Phyllobacterium sp. OV277 TaxID=1882772 RepID=UPI0008813E3F|nr:GGDEF domain-containing protein [Phyllobacterium sp. OV277]SDN89048.1 diguanylate cyclase/phosphodiesterase [Phyllobacterium sp. OV277]
MSFQPAEKLVLRRFGDDQLVTLAKLAIETAFQPIVEAATGATFGYESLMRGFDRLGFGSPPELLDKAYDVGQLAELEQMINIRAFAGFSGLPGFAHRMLFINIDARLISLGNNFVERLTTQLIKASIRPSSICFELSERFDNTKDPAFTALINKLRHGGFKLAIDDFGVGFNGLKLLCDYPTDYVKIDRHFISGLDASARKRHIVKQIVQMAHMLGARVIAEGVETEAEYVVCRDLGCDLVQGYYIARPTTNVGELQDSYPHLEQAGTGRRQTTTLDSILIRAQVQRLPVVHENDDLDNVFELFRKNPQQSFFPVLGANDEPRGVLHEYHVKAMIYHPFGRDLLKNRIYQRGISHFVTGTPIADLDTPAEQMLKIFAGIDGSDCVILTENLRYAGVLSASSLLKIINEKQLKTAQDQNPLTGLPGNRSIRDYVQDVMRDSSAPRFFCYCDFDNFKPFNDHYGFQKGDLALGLFASLLRHHFVGEDKFLGHVGGDDFFIGISGGNRADVEERLTSLLSDFQTNVLDLYTPEDRAAGAIRAHDRSGGERHFPLMRCSIAVLEIAEGLIHADVNRVSASIATIKASAKANPTGLVFSSLTEIG